MMKLKANTRRCLGLFKSTVMAGMRDQRRFFLFAWGVTAANICDYLAMPVGPAAGGTWIAKTDVMNAGDWASIEANAREVRAVIDAWRAKA